MTIVYYNGEFVEKSQVAISPDDRGFLFADGVYEVIRAYAGRLFKCAEHLDRLAYGLKELRFVGLEPHSLQQVATRLLKDNDLEASDATIYIQVTRGAAPRKHRFPTGGTPLTVYVEAKALSPPVEAQQNGVTAITVPDQRWARCDIKTISLLPNALAHQQAYEAGAFEAIFSRNGVLQEGTHSSILFVKDDVLTFPPLTNYVLPSITREVVHSAAVAQSIPTATRPCHEHELSQFQEILMVGTTVEVTPIISVNGRKIGGGIPGPVARKLQAAFQDFTQPAAP